jgi:hypothetical protein
MRLLCVKTNHLSELEHVPRPTFMIGVANSYA